MTEGKTTIILVAACMLLAAMPPAANAEDTAAEKQLKEWIESEYPSLEATYKHLHAHPELSLQEKETSALVARELTAAGYEVATGIGGFGVVGVLRNGEGPTVLLRGDMDALPITEATGLPYASTVRATDSQGREVGVMHACGHDVHTTVLIGNALALAALREHWSGTLVIVAQPAEEGYGGAMLMFDDGLYERFPRPDFALALHCAPSLPAGTVGYTEGQALAGTISLGITVKGRGGHGALPHTTKDPIVIAARLILALQTIVSREIDPNEMTVITVGEVHGGTAANIIPNEVKLKLNLRFASSEVMEQMMAAIERECRGIAISAGLPEELMPVVERANDPNPPVYNDPELVGRSTAVFKRVIGEANVFPIPLITASEDFAFFRREDEPKVQAFLFWLGFTDPEFFNSIADKAPEELSEKEAGRLALHTPYCYPLPEPTIKTGVTTVSAAVLDILRK